MEVNDTNEPLKIAAGNNMCNYVGILEYSIENNFY